MAKTGTERNGKYRRAKPWSNNLRCARDRCNRKNNKFYRWYGGRGIECFLTLKQVKVLWDRDDAAAMHRPSLDRINPDGHYIMDNCRFIPLSVNIANGNRARVRTRIDEPPITEGREDGRQI